MFNINRRKNQCGGRKEVRQATILAHWAQKVGGRLLAVANQLRV